MDFSEDDLSRVLDRARAKRGATYPSGSWDQLATFTSLRSPRDFDVEAFRRFQERLRELTGIEAFVVGGGYGCIRLIVRLSKGDPTHSVDSEIDISAEFPEGRADDAARLLAMVMTHLPQLRAQGLAAGIDRIQTKEATIDLRTGDVTSMGSGGQAPLYLVQVNPVFVSGSVGQIGDHNSQSDAQIGLPSEKIRKS